jgi:PAS domain S-box-containing protein
MLESFLGRSGLLPHGTCLQWSPTLLWSMAGADTVIALAYFSIPLAILEFVRRRGGMAAGYGVVPWLFSAFIFSCGLMHVMHVWTLWRPDYGLLALSKLLTAGASTLTAFALWPLIPRALKIPRIDELQAAIVSLEAEVGRRRSAEEHARDSERGLALTLASIDAAFIATDAAGRITRMNAVAARITGWTQAEAQGQLLGEVLAREGLSEPSDPVQAALSSSDVIDLPRDVWILLRRGGRALVELRTAVTRDEVGLPARSGPEAPVRGLVAIFRDVTRLREAEAELPRLAAIVESSEDAIIGQTLDGRITNWNRAAQQMFGYSAEEAIGQPVQMLLAPDRQAAELDLLTALSRGERILPFHTERRAKGGKPVEVLVSISPILDVSEKIVGASKIARDVSHLHRAEAALLETQTRLEFALEAGKIGDWDFDVESGLTRRSLRHDRCFGYNALQPHWTLETFSQHLHPDDREAVLGEFEHVLGEGREWHFDFRVIWPDRSVHWLSAHGRNFAQPGQRRRVLGIVIDMTRQKLAEATRLTTQRLEAENQQIQASSRLKNQFLANMSHELRTPLNAIIGFSDLLHRGAVPADSPKHREFLGHIGASGRHLLQLINDVLDLSKVESGKFEFQPETVDLALLVADVTGVLHTQLQGKQLTLQVDIDAGLGPLQLDPGRLKQALYNYLSNAIKFTPAGGQIWVRARPEGDLYFRLEVADSGIGIATPDVPRLFVEFQQLESGHDKQHQGTGLGLALTRRLVQAQSGTVGVRSQPGRGSVFHLVLPRRPLSAADAAPPQLLLVDEDGPRRNQQLQALQQAGCEVDTVADPAQALRQARSPPYDGIALGLVQPDAGGLALVGELHAVGLGNGDDVPPVRGISVALGAQTSAAFGVADVLPKPMLGREVLQALAANGLAPDNGCRVMVVDDDSLALELMHHTLQSGGYIDLGWTDGRAALRDLDIFRPDAIVLDLMMPGFDGFAVLDALEQLPDWRATPVFVWTSLLLTEAEFEQLQQTARAVLAKGGGLTAGLVEKLRLWRPGPSAAAEPAQ